MDRGIVLYLDCGGDYTTIYICQNYALKRMNFTVYTTYLKINGEEG